MLPVVSLGWAHRAIAGLPVAEQPGRGEVIRGSIIPWKPIALMAICTFAMQFATMPGAPLVAGNLLGVAAACLFVILGSLSTSRWFNFDSIYRVAFPLVCAASLLVTPLMAGRGQLAAFFYDGGYTMMSMFVMIILANITYRFAINATWLNGIERAIRYFVETAGWGAYALAGQALPTAANNAVHVAVALAVFVAFLAIVLSEKSLGARWGIDLHEDVGGDGVPAPETVGRAGTSPAGPASAVDQAAISLASPSPASPPPAARASTALPAAPVAPMAPDPFAPGRLSLRVSDLARTHGLTDREEEVLQLMARRVPMEQMEQSLFVARGTIKAHTGRIYKKLGVHSRAELFALLGVES